MKQPYLICPALYEKQWADNLMVVGFQVTIIYSLLMSKPFILYQVYISKDFTLGMKKSEYLILSVGKYVSSPPFINKAEYT